MHPSSKEVLKLDDPPPLQLITPFWRAEPFTIKERQLLQALFLAHGRSALRDNPSTVTVAYAAAGSGSLSKAIAAALLTIGHKHAPLVQTVCFLSLPDLAQAVPKILQRGSKIPGWGGTYQKNAPDPIWQDVHNLLSAWPELSLKLGQVTGSLHHLGKIIYPNPSAYTAALAIAIGLPAPLAPYLFIAARLSAWTLIAAHYLLSAPKEPDPQY